MTHVYHSYGRCDYIFDIYSDHPSVKDSGRLRRCTATPVLMSTVAETTPLPKDMATFWPSSNNKVLLEKVIYSHVRNESSEGHEHPTILSQLCMDSGDWQCIKIHNNAEHYKRHLQSTVEEADLRIPMHVLDCLQAGYKTCVVISLPPSIPPSHPPSISPSLLDHIGENGLPTEVITLNAKQRPPRFQLME